MVLGDDFDLAGERPNILNNTLSQVAEVGGPEAVDMLRQV